MDLNTIWFVLVAVLLAGYCILDGFDFGVGILHLFARDNEERRIHINAIAPVWDGNEVWLITGAGAIFAAFPIVYATVFSGFYLALMLLLFALIFRAVSMEFRGKVDSHLWRRVWDWAFGFGSLLPALLLGVAFGNILQGIPINEKMMFTGSFLGLLNPIALLVGVLNVSLCTMHGAVYLLMKTEDELRSRMQKWVLGSWILTVALFLGVTLAFYLTMPSLMTSAATRVGFWIFAVLMVGAIVAAPLLARGKRSFLAFTASSTVILSMFGIAAVSLFPRLVPSSMDPAFSLTIYNACSTPRTLSAMLIIALIGMPLVIGYTIFIYRVFKGRVEITAESY